MYSLELKSCRGEERYLERGAQHLCLSQHLLERLYCGIAHIQSVSQPIHNRLAFPLFFLWKRKRKRSWPGNPDLSCPHSSRSTTKTLLAISGSRLLGGGCSCTDTFPQVLSAPGSILSTCFSHCQQASRFSLLKIKNSF